MRRAIFLQNAAAQCNI